MTKDKREWWAFPWDYRESLFISFAIILTGLLLDYIRLKTISFLFPNNFILLGILLVVIILQSTKYRKSGLSKWLSSIQASITAILLFVVFSIVIALIPNGVQNNFIEGGITRSWMYHFTSLYMFLVLGVITCKKIINYKRKNIFFILSHLGLWIVLFFASTSSYNISILQMYVDEGNTVWYAYDKSGEKIDVPFAIKLNKFDIDEYIPKIAFVDNESGVLVEGTIKHLEQGDSCQINGIPIKLKTFYKESVNYSGEYRHSNMPGAPASMLVELMGHDEWISCGSHIFPSKMSKINDQYSIVMLNPEPKRYYSEVTVYEKEGEVKDYTLEVNKPLSVKGWQVYQKSYNKDMGRWSSLSVIELVRDPYLWLVYFGCLLMVVGSFFLILKGKSNG